MATRNLVISGITKQRPQGKFDSLLSLLAMSACSEIVSVCRMTACGRSETAATATRQPEQHDRSCANKDPCSRIVHAAGALPDAQAVRALKTTE
jgi:hypothetical protein